MRTPALRHPTLRSSFLLLLALIASPLPCGAQEASPPSTFRNPLKAQSGADPWLVHHDGWYYLATTTAIDIRIRRAQRLAELKDAPDQVVRTDDTPSRSRHIWAPEFHRLDGGSGPRWYLYYTASDDVDDAHHRLYVAESAGDDPMGPYTFKAKLRTDPDDAFYAIDGTVLTTPGGDRYFLWCGRPSPAGQGLYIARMENPWTLVGPRTYLPADGFGCRSVREGPVILHREGRVLLIYSTCPADTPDYKLGLLIADAKADLLDPASWTQHPAPVFERDDAAGVYGPGHNGFFRSPDGTQDWIVYHAKTSTRRTYADRTTRAQPFTWGPDGLPHFGRPLALATDIPAPSGEPPAEATPDDDVRRHQGTWAVVSMEYNGRRSAEEVARSIRRIVKDDHVAWERDGKRFAGTTVVLDPAQDPKAIDVIPDGGRNRGERVLGIYKLDGDELTICMAGPGGERPKAFAAGAGTRQTLMVLHREGDGPRER